MIISQPKFKSQPAPDTKAQATAPAAPPAPTSWKSAADSAGRPGARAATLTETERQWKRQVFERVVKALDLSLLGTIDGQEGRRQIKEACESLIAEDSAPINALTRQRIVQEIQNEILGLGPLEPLLADPTVSDILVNGPDKVFVERRGKLELSSVNFDNDQHLMTIIERIVARVGRRIDESSPMVDARLPDGSRVNAIIPPLALDGAAMSIRRFPVERLTMDGLVGLGALSPEMALLLEAVSQARLNVLISGGTGSGKTTLLNVLSSFIPSDERIVTIEDSAELQLQQPHVVRLETRPPSIEGRGEVTQRDLVRNALRMRPDRIVVGEVRGAEALDMLQAMNTGHDGSLTTIHANNTREALGRIENMVSMSGLNLPPRGLRAQIASAIDVAIQLERMQDGKRRIVSIDEVQGMEGEVIVMAPVFIFERRGIDIDGRVLGQHKPSGVVPKFQERFKQRGIPIELSVYRSESFI
jgi:pilus assembly protein CpaF